VLGVILDGREMVTVSIATHVGETIVDEQQVHRQIVTPATLPTSWTVWFWQLLHSYPLPCLPATGLSNGCHQIAPQVELPQWYAPLL